MKRKFLIVFNDMMADMEAYKKLKPTVAKLFMRDKKNSTFHLFLYRNLISNCLKI